MPLFKGKIQALCVMSHDTILSYGSVDKKLSLWETRKSSQSSSPDTMIEVSDLVRVSFQR